MPAPRAGKTSLNSKPISCCPLGVDQSCAISAMSVLVFYRLLQQAVIIDPVTYDDDVKPLSKPAKRGSITGWASSVLVRLELSGYTFWNTQHFVASRPART